MMMMMAVNKDTHGGFFLFYFLFLSFLLMFDVNGLTEWRWSWERETHSNVVSSTIPKK